jgi:hypothetical protein
MLWIRQFTTTQHKYDDGLPTSIHQRDGSARAIHIPNPLVQSWRRLNPTTRITYSAGAFFLLLLLWSIHHLFYAHGTFE